MKIVGDVLFRIMSILSGFYKSQSVTNDTDYWSG